MPDTNGPNESPQSLVQNLTVELMKESDRTIAVLIAAHLDHLLGTLISMSMAVPPKEVVSILIDNGADAPLGRFSSRIDAAYCLGAIDSDQRHDLHLIRKIRNDFAHKLVGLTLNTHPIAPRCTSLKGAHVGGRLKDPRECLVKAAIRLVVASRSS